MWIKRWLMEENDGDGSDLGGGTTPAPDGVGQADTGGDSGAPAGAPPAADDAGLRASIESAFKTDEEAALDGAPPADKTPEQRSRDEKGRFAKAEEARREAESRKPAAPGAKPAQPAALPADADRLAKPPQSWKPEARAEWEKLSPGVRAEVYRREQEVSGVLQESARHKSIVGEMTGLLQPYSQNVQASGMNAMQMTRSLFQADHELRHGTPQHKARVIANIIKTYGVDIAALDDTLANGPAPDDPQTQMQRMVQEQLRRELAPVNQFMQTLQQQRQSAAGQVQQAAAGDIDSFAIDPANEFFEDVREEMADRLEAASRRGVAMTLKQAYDASVRVHPVHSETVAQRMAAERAKANGDAVRRARSASGSVAGSGAPAGHGAPGGTPADLRSAIEAAVDASAG